MTKYPIFENSSIMKNLNLLIIDDDIEICRMLSKTLKKHWKSVTTKYNCDDGLVAIKTGNFDVVLSDWDCPNEADGLKIIKNSTIPVVIYTGNSMVRQHVRDFHVIDKPADISEINETLINIWLKHFILSRIFIKD